MIPDTLLELCEHTARNGSTTLLVEAAKRAPALILTGDRHEVSRLKALGVEALHVNAADTGKVIGTARALLVDPFALQVIVVAWLADRTAKENAARYLAGVRGTLLQTEAEAKRLRADVAALRTERDELRERLEGLLGES